MIMPDRNYHESSRAHVTGAALYADDISNIGNLLMVVFKRQPWLEARSVLLNLERVTARVLV